MKFASTINLTIITMMIIIYLNEMRNISAFIFNFNYIKDLARIIMDEKCNHVYCEAETDRYQIAKNSYRLLMPNDVFNSKTYIIFAFIVSIMIFIYYYRMLDLSNYEGTWQKHTAYVIIHALLLIILLGMIIYRYTPHDEAGYLNYFKYFRQGSTQSDGFVSAVGLLMYLFIPLSIVLLKRWNEKLWEGTVIEKNIKGINIFVALCCFIASITLMFNLMNIVMSFRTNTRPILKTKCLGWSLQQSFKGHVHYKIDDTNKATFIENTTKTKTIETEYDNINKLTTETNTAAKTKSLLEGCGANISSALDVLIAFEELTNVVINGLSTEDNKHTTYVENLKKIINTNFTKINNEKNTPYTQDTSEFALIFDKKVSIPNYYGQPPSGDSRFTDNPRFSSEHSVNSNDRNKDYVYTADISYDNANVFYEKYWDMNDTEHDFLWRYDYFVPTYLFGGERPNLLKILNYVATFTVSIVVALAIICLCLSITYGVANKDIFKKIFNIKTLYDLLIPFIALVVFLTFIIVFIRFNTNFNKNVVYKCLDCSYKRALNKLNTVVSPYIRMYDNKITTGNKNYLSHYIVTNVFYSILSGNINLNNDVDRAINKAYDAKYYYGTVEIKSNRLKFTDMNNSILSNDNQFREYYKSRYSDLYKSVADDKTVLSDEIKNIYNVFLNIFACPTVPKTADEINTYFQGTILKRETIRKIYNIIKKCFELFNEETFNNNLIYYNNRDPTRNSTKDTQITIESYEHFAFYKNGDKLIPHQFILKLKSGEYDAFIGTGAAGFTTEFDTALSKFSPQIATDATDMTPILSDISDEDSINQTPEVRNKNLIKIIAKYLLILGHINYNGCEYNLYDDETIKNEIYELRTRNLYKLFSNVSYNDTFEIDDTFTSINIEGSNTVKHIIVRDRGKGYSDTDKDIKITPTGVNTTPVIANANINYAVLASILITDGGSGYITAPTIAITGGSGSGATATAHLSDLGIVSIKVVKAGSGYTSVPTIKIEGGDGTGATATATLNTDKTVKSIKVDTAGAGYTSAPTIKIEGVGGTGAEAKAYLGIENKITNPKYKTLTYMYNYLETKYVSLSSNNNKNYLLNVVKSINNTLNNDDKTITASGSKDSKYLFAKKINEMKVPPEYEYEDAIYTKADYISTTSFETTYYMNLLILICFIIGTIYANIKKSV